MNARSTCIWICIAFGVFLMVASKTGPSHEKVVVCYVSTWAVYRPGKGSFAIENIDPNLCTHLVYAFTGLDPVTDSIKSLDPWQDLKENHAKDGFGRIIGLKQTYPHLKVSVAIGGWVEGSKNYSIMAADSTRRKRFVKSATEFVLRYKFDGLDLDWEYPTQREGAPHDRENFVALAKELKESFKPHNLLLTSAIGASKSVIDQAYDIQQLSKYLDYLHIMCYDYGGAWDKRITANAPLKGNGPLNIEFTIDYLIKLGAPPSKIILGIPLYGRTFVTNRAGNFEDPSNDIGFPGSYTRENGFMGYNEICEVLSNRSSGFVKSWDPATEQGVAKYVDEEKGETKVVVFDSTRSVANKMRFAMKRSLGGAMVWSIDTDDFLGNCEIDTDTFADFKPLGDLTLRIPNRFNRNYPLLRTINEAIVITLDEIDADNEIKDNEIPHGDKGSADSVSATFKTLVASIAIVTYLRLIN